MDIKICSWLIRPIIEFKCFQQVINIHRSIENHFLRFSHVGSFTGTTIAGRSGTAGSSISELYSPSAVYVDGNSNMYILDTTNYRVLRWRIGEPLGYVVAGGNSAGASLTQISTSYGMFVDSQLNIYVSDAGNDRVTKWLATNRTSGILVYFDRSLNY